MNEFDYMRSYESWFVGILLLLVFFSTWYKIESSGNREPQLRKCLHKIAYREGYKAFFLLKINTVVQLLGRQYQDV